MSRRRLYPLALIALASLCLAAPARAQLSASASLDSDYRFRGVSLTDGRPVLTVGATYDDPSGFYVGAAATAQDTRRSSLQMLGYGEYAGFALRMGNGGPTLDLGVSNQSIAQFYERRTIYQYTEAYAGLIGRVLSAHLYYSPNYFRPGTKSLYASLDAVLRPADDWLLTGHLGALTPISNTTGAVQHERYDLRLGVARQFRRFEVHVAMTATAPNPPPRTPQSRAAVVVGTTVFF